MSGDLYLVVLAVAAVLVASVAAVRLSHRSGLPGLLLFLLLGLGIGESGLGVTFDDAVVAQVAGTLLLGMILLEGGFTTRFDDLRPVLGRSAVLASAGVLASVAVTTGLVYLMLDVDLRTAVILGAVASSTDAAATFSILRRIRIKPRTRATLEAESGFNDPPVIILIAVVTSDLWNEASAAAMVGSGLYQLAMGAAVGFVVALVGQWLLTHVALSASGLYPIATLAVGMVAFASAGLLGASGLLACYVAGLWLGNASLPHRRTTEGFAESLAWLSQMGLFIMLGLLATPSRLPDAILPALVVGAALTFVARPFSVAVCLAPMRVGLGEQAFISWAGLRGAVPIVLATIPMTAGLPSAHRIFDIVFLLVVVFTLIQGPLLPLVSRLTGVTDAGAGVQLDFESAPFEQAAVSTLTFAVPPGSRLAGTRVDELRLPVGAIVSMVLREGVAVAGEPSLRIVVGDQLVIATHAGVLRDAQHRIAAVHRSGRLARWLEPDRPSPRRGSARAGPPRRRRDQFVEDGPPDSHRVDDRVVGLGLPRVLPTTQGRGRRRQSLDLLDRRDEPTSVGR